MLRVSDIQDAIGNLKNNLLFFCVFVFCFVFLLLLFFVCLFFFAVNGSDTKSSPCQQGKEKGCRVLESNNQLKQTVTVFNTLKKAQRTLPKLVKNVC